MRVTTMPSFCSAGRARCLRGVPVKIARYKLAEESGPKFTLVSPNGSRPAKHAGPFAALIEAQNEALRSTTDTEILVKEEEEVIYRVRAITETHTVETY